MKATTDNGKNAQQSVKRKQSKEKFTEHTARRQTAKITPTHRNTQPKALLDRKARIQNGFQ